MRLSKRTFFFLILATLMLLFYVHFQTGVFRVSYSIEKQEREIAKLNEAYKIAKFRVARLRSPRVLSERMKKFSLDLTSPKDQEFIRVLKPKAVTTRVEAGWHGPFQTLAWLNLIKEAQAKSSKD
ncbi:MAG: hypothetical protein HY584_01340 [Candidatus Omnitrophica bacterium]|nr:hypothetical protein [Candidatus Omnitrophota bacterium]